MRKFRPARLVVLELVLCPWLGIVWPTCLGEWPWDGASTLLFTALLSVAIWALVVGSVGLVWGLLCGLTNWLFGYTDGEWEGLR